MKLKLTKVTPQKNRFGKNDFIITMVTAYKDDGTYIKHLPLTNELCNMIEGQTIDVQDNLFYKIEDGKGL